MRIAILAAAAVTGAAAGHLPEKDRMAAGYNDGFTVGYSTACAAEPVAVVGEWGNSSYSQGYAAGVMDGSLACLSAQRP
jgi:hypothetical protein